MLSFLRCNQIPWTVTDHTKNILLKLLLISLYPENMASGIGMFMMIIMYNTVRLTISDLQKPSL